MARFQLTDDLSSVTLEAGCFNDALELAREAHKNSSLPWTLQELADGETGGRVAGVHARPGRILPAETLPSTGGNID